MNIAVLLTCHNRKEKTLSCLRTLFSARERYANSISLNIYLTDDGCTDGTSDAVRSSFTNEEITILQGDGNLFWAGGMRMAWKEALKHHRQWDYYLLLNDDTDMFPTLFDEIFSTEEYSIKNYGQEAIVSGITCSKSDHNIMTYGGDVWTNKFLARQKRLKPSQHPQMCDMTNANILLVPVYVVDAIGIFDDGFLHGVADYDYTTTAREHDIPVLVTSRFCGSCDKDHDTSAELRSKICTMTYSQRKKYFSFPTHSSNDPLLFMKKHAPVRYPLVWIGRKMELLCPQMYYFLLNLRKGGKK